MVHGRRRAKRELGWLVPVLGLAMGLGAPQDVAGWDGHELLTAEAIASVSWLEEYRAIPVTPFSYQIDGIQQAYGFPYRGELPGETIPAREILIRYSVEPDLGPDQELRASWQQRFMGGYRGMSSRGYFHMYYPAFTVHVPVPGIPMGAAPRRLVLWYEKAREAFGRHDPYWGFRFLACALHYIEDVAQPYHATQTALALLDPRSPIAGTTQITTNYHSVYENWVFHQMTQEASGQVQHGLLAATRGSDAVRFEDLEDYVRKVAARSHREASGLIRACLDFFDRRFRIPVDQPSSPGDLSQLEPAEPRLRMVGRTVPALALTGRSIRGFLAHAREELLEGRPAMRRETFDRLHGRKRQR